MCFDNFLWILEQRWKHFSHQVWGNGLERVYSDSVEKWYAHFAKSTTSLNTRMATWTPSIGRMPPNKLCYSWSDDDSFQVLVVLTVRRVPDLGCQSDKKMRSYGFTGTIDCESDNCKQTTHSSLVIGPVLITHKHGYNQLVCALFSRAMLPSTNNLPRDAWILHIARVS